jgi:hypothetical protein
MAVTLRRCAEHLVAAGVRHHLDAQEQVIRVVRITREYRSRRDEKLAILQVTAPDDGRRCRVTIERAFAVGPDAARTCLDLCRAAAATPVVGVEFDAEFENLRMVAEAVVEDGDLTRRQLVSMVDGLVEAAEIWHASVCGARLSAAG